MPKVSVVTPSYNHGRFLRERLASILNQTFDDFEWIIVDDNSSDNSRSILEAAALEDSRIRLFFHERNLGMAATVRAAIAESCGMYVYRAESDDTCDRRLLQRMVEVLDMNPTVGLVHCRALHLDETGFTWGGLRQRHGDRVTQGLDAFRSLVMKYDICGSNMMFTRKAHNEVGGFAAGPFLSACDYHFSLRVSLQFDLAYIAEPLGYHRAHNTNLSNTVQRTLDLDFLCRESFEVLLETFRRVPAPHHLAALLRPALRNVTYQAVAGTYIEALLSGRRGVCKELKRRAEGYDPGGTTGLGWWYACSKALFYRTFSHVYPRFMKALDYRA